MVLIFKRKTIFGFLSNLYQNVDYVTFCCPFASGIARGSRGATTPCSIALIPPSANKVKSVTNCYKSQVFVHD